MIRKWIGRRTIMLLIIAILILGCFIWYRELGANREDPKRARLVYKTLMESEGHR